MNFENVFNKKRKNPLKTLFYSKKIKNNNNKYVSKEKKICFKAFAPLFWCNN